MNRKRLLRIAFFILLISVLLLSGCTYNPPEGYTRTHHTYEEVLAYAKTLDPDATVSEEYTDTTIDDWNRSFREWPAVINGIKCHVSSVGDMVFNGGFAAGEFARQYFYIDTDYDYLLLQQIVQEKQPDWSMKSDDISSRYSWNHILVVQTSYSDEQPLTDEELEIAWQEALEIHEEYSKYPVRNLAQFGVAAPGTYVDGMNPEQKYIKISSVNMHDFSPEGKDEFMNQYKDRWALMESDLPVKD